jgi:L-ascorbate metabolism protein UlaG (beta-lactamase superfamily)
LTRYHPAAVLVTHSHFDHSQDAVEVAKASGARVISSSDWIVKVGLPEKQQLGCNVGGTIRIGDITIHVVPAMHSSEPSGRPLGFVLTFSDGRSLYDTGDTWIFGDMALIEELYHPTVILLNAGGGYWGSDPKTAALEIQRYFKPEVVVPMHFGTLPQMAKAAEVRAAFAGDRRLVVMIPETTKRF